MKTRSEDLTAKESLDIITSMIHQAKGNAKRNSFHFLLWGWVIMLANVGMYVLTMADYSRPYIVWLITIPAWILSFYVGFRNREAERVYTHLDRIHLSSWTVFGVCIATIIFFGYKIAFQINPMIILISSIPTLISGITIRFRPLMFGAAAFWFFGIICFLTETVNQPIVGALAVTCGYLIPGYLLRLKKD
jgi:hypothetical protein